MNKTVLNYRKDFLFRLPDLLFTIISFAIILITVLNGAPTVYNQSTIIIKEQSPQKILTISIKIVLFVMMCFYLLFFFFIVFVSFNDGIENRRCQIKISHLQSVQEKGPVNFLYRFMPPMVSVVFMNRVIEFDRYKPSKPSRWSYVPAFFYVFFCKSVIIRTCPYFQINCCWRYPVKNFVMKTSVE